MKKSVAAALTGALVIGAASTTFAAANPFSDVPAGHWAYDAVTQLAADGVIEGYGDGTFLGNRNITRYEMAQMVAKALARAPQGGTDRAALDRLAAEFADELSNLGVRVSELEKYADKVQLFGKIEYTYKSHRTDRYYRDDNGNLQKAKGKEKVNQDDWIFRFEPVAHVNDHWTLRARIDAHNDMSRNDSSDFSLVRGWAQGDYSNFQVKVGKQPLYTNEDGIVWDTEYSGAEVTFGNRLKATIYAGRLAAGTVTGSVRNAGHWNGRQDGNGNSDSKFGAATGVLAGTTDDPSSFQAINVQYTPAEHGLFGGAAFYHINDSDFKNAYFEKTDGTRIHAYSKNDKEDDANIWSVNAGYKFGRKAQLWGAYASNTKADYEDNSWQALFKYGATKAPRKALGLSGLATRNSAPTLRCALSTGMTHSQAPRVLSRAQAGLRWIASLSSPSTSTANTSPATAMQSVSSVVSSSSSKIPDVNVR